MEHTRKCFEKGIEIGFIEGVTWDDIMEAIPHLQARNMEIGLTANITGSWDGEKQDKGLSVKDIAEDLPLFACIKEKVVEKISSPALDELNNLNPDDLSPREALEKLYELKKLL